MNQPNVPRLRLALWAVGLTVALVLVVAAGSWLLVHRYGAAFTREQIADGLAKALDRPVRLDRVVLRPWLARVTIEGLAIGAGESWEAGTLARVRRADVSLSVVSLWRRQIVLDLSVDDVDVVYEAAADGDPFVVPDVIPDRIAVGPVTAVIGSVRLDEARVRYVDPVAGWTVDVRGLSARARPAEGGADVTLAARTVRGVSGRTDEVVEALRVDAALRGHDLVVSALRMRWRGEELSLEGRVTELAADPVVAVKMRGRLPLDALVALADLGQPVRGVVTFDGTLDGRAQDLRAAARVSIPELAVAAVTARAVSGQVRWSDGTLRLSEVKARALGGGVSGALVVTPARPDDARLTLRLDGVSVEETEALAGRTLGARGHVTAAGELRGDLRRLAEGEGTFHVESRDLVLPEPLARLGAGALSAEARVATGSVDIVRAQADWPGVQARDVAGRFTVEGPRGLGGTLVADVGTLTKAWGYDGVAGRGRMTVALGGGWHDLTARGEAHAAPLTVAGVTVTAADVDFHLSGRELRLPSVSARMNVSRVEGAATIAWSGPLEAARWREAVRFVATVAVPEGHVQDLDRWLPADWRGAGRFTMTAGRVEGTPAVWRGGGRLASEGLTVRGERITDVEAQVSIDPTGVEASSVRAVVRAIPVTATGAWQWQSASGRARVSAGPVPLATVPAVGDVVNVSGEVRADADLTLQAGVVSGTATALGEGVTVGGVRLGRGTVEAQLARSGVTASLAFPESRVTATASGMLTPGRDIAVRAQVSDFDLAPVLARFTVPAAAGDVQGRVSGTAAFTVPYSAPSAAHGTLQLDPVHLRVAGQEWRNIGAIVLARQPGTTRLQTVKLESAAGTVSATGVVADGGSLDVALQGRASLDVIAALREEIREAAGTLEVDGRVTGTMSAPRMTGGGSVSGGRVVARDFPEPITGIRGRFTLDGERVHVVEAVATVSGGEVRANGTVDVRAPAPRLDVRLTGRLPLSALAALRPEVSEAAGTLEVDGRVTGTMSAPRMTGGGSVSGGRVVARDFPEPITGIRGRFTLDGERVHVVEAVATVSGGEVRASGTVDVRAPAPRLDVRLTGRLPLSALAALRPEVSEAAGILEVDGRVSGTTAAPQAVGEGTIRDGRLLLAAYPEALRDVQGRFTVSAAGVRLTSATAAVGGGSLAAHGHLALAGRDLGPFRFDVEVRGVTVEPAAGARTTWDADLELVGVSERRLLRGEARLLRGTYVSDQPLLRLALAGLPGGGGGGGGSGPGLPVQIRVRLDDNLVVRTAVARFRAGGVVTLQGTTAAPVLFGTVDVREGQIIFRKQRFTITSASARFTDPRRIDPILDVQAQARIQAYDVTLRMTGRADNLEVRLASSPTLPEEDVLSLVAFGTTREQLSRGGATAVAGEMAGLLLQDLFGLQTGEGSGLGVVDVLEMQTTEEEGRSVRVGRRLTERTRVLYSQGIDRSDARRLRLEYEVMGPLVLAGEQDFRGGFGGDVVLRLRFR